MLTHHFHVIGSWPDCQQCVAIVNRDAEMAKADEKQLETIAAQKKEIARLKAALESQSHEVEQILAQALGGYPWYKDDQANFPGAAEKDGVCVGDHVPESLAAEAAAEIGGLRAAFQNWHDKLEAGTLHVLHCNGNHNKPVGAPGMICNCRLGRQIQDQRARIAELKLALVDVQQDLAKALDEYDHD